VGTPDGVPIIAPEYADMNELYRSRLKLEDLPAAAQETVRREAGGRDIADIDEERWNERRVYEVEFRQSGRNPQIHVAEDGTIVREERNRATLKTLFLGTQLTDTPPAVQETVRRVAGDRPILDIDKRGSPGDVVYRIVVRSGSGREVLHIGEDGKVMQDRGPAAPARRGE
jgi:hypothetical protein